MKRQRWLIVLVPVLALVLASAAALAQTPGSSVLSSKHNDKLGDILAGNKDLTLYVFTKDAPNTSNCTGDCAASWPPLISNGSETLPAGWSGTLGTITRSDGTVQVTYNQMPLYYFAKDDDDEDAYGQGVGGVWFVVTDGATFETVATPTAGSVASPMASPVAGTSTVLVAHSDTLGDYLTDAKGNTLYLYKKDTTPGQSACTDACAANWPPFTADEPLTLPDGVQGTLATITRTDGTKQVTYNGTPLYYYAADTKPGDTNGQGIGSVWYVVAPASGNATPSSSPDADDSGY